MTDASTVSGIAPHHMPLVYPMLDDFYNQIGPVDTYVLLGPRHDDKISNSVITTNKCTNSNIFITKKLIESGLVKIEDKGFLGEHSIAVHMDFIIKKYPRAKFVPLLLRSDASHAVVKKLAEILQQNSGDKTVVIASVDLAHYLPLKKIIEQDKKTIEKITNLQTDKIRFGEVDSCPAVIALLEYVQLKGIKKGKLIRYSNTAQLTGNRAKEFTGYATILFNEDSVVEILAVGDIMLSRTVGEIMEKRKNWKWPFLFVAPYLKSADFIMGNLETPISTQGKAQFKSYVFRANPKAIDGLKESNFKLLSLANNHCGDYGTEAYFETQKLLKDNGLDWVGYDLKENGFTFKKYVIKGQKLAIVAYSEIMNIPLVNVNLGKKKLLAEIKNLKQTGYLVFLLIHFGEEYQEHSNKHQQTLARFFIDNGVNVIMGSHPHVVQEIENYKKGYIAYSLGNFIFDQMFSDQTKRGLLLKIVIKNGTISKVVPVPIFISNSLQVRF